MGIFSRIISVLFVNLSEILRSFKKGLKRKKIGLNATRKMTPPKAQLRFDYQQSLLLGEVRSASPKKYMKKNCCQRATETLGVTPMRRRSSIREAVKNLALVRTSHSKSSPHRANINFFFTDFLLFFFCFLTSVTDFAEKEGLLVV